MRIFGRFISQGGEGGRGRVGIAHAIVFKTKLVRDEAYDVDWAGKEALDFNDTWDTMLLNVRWSRELAGEVE